MKVGQWTARQGTQGLITRWHLIESMIIGMPVTRCGRYLPLQNGRGVLATVDYRPAAGECIHCAPGGYAYREEGGTFRLYKRVDPHPLNTSTP